MGEYILTDPKFDYMPNFTNSGEILELRGGLKGRVTKVNKGYACVLIEDDLNTYYAYINADLEILSTCQLAR